MWLDWRDTQLNLMLVILSQSDKWMTVHENYIWIEVYHINDKFIE